MKMNSKQAFNSKSATAQMPSFYFFSFEREDRETQTDRQTDGRTDGLTPFATINRRFRTSKWRAQSAKEA